MGTVGDLYYEEKLSKELTNSYEVATNNPEAHFWGDVSKDEEPCVALMDSVGANKLELIAIFSPYLESVNHPSHVAERATFLGFDVCPVGGWSLLYELENKITRMPTMLSERLNESGLLRDKSDMAVVAELYGKLADLDVVEAWEESNSATPSLPLETVAVYAIRLDKPKTQR